MDADTVLGPDHEAIQKALDILSIQGRRLLLLVQIGMGIVWFLACRIHSTVYPQRVLVGIMFVALALATVAALCVRIAPAEWRPPGDHSA